MKDPLRGWDIPEHLPTAAKPVEDDTLSLLSLALAGCIGLMAVFWLW